MPKLTDKYYDEITDCEQSYIFKDEYMRAGIPDAVMYARFEFPAYIQKRNIVDIAISRDWSHRGAEMNRIRRAVFAEWDRHALLVTTWTGYQPQPEFKTKEEVNATSNG